MTDLTTISSAAIIRMTNTKPYALTPAEDGLLAAHSETTDRIEEDIKTSPHQINGTCLGRSLSKSEAQTFREVRLDMPGLVNPIDVAIEILRREDAK